MIPDHLDRGPVVDGHPTFYGELVHVPLNWEWRGFADDSEWKTGQTDHEKRYPSMIVQCRPGPPATEQVHWSRAPGRRRDTGTYIARVEKLDTGIVVLYSTDGKQLVGWSEVANPKGVVDVLVEETP